MPRLQCLGFRVQGSGFRVWEEEMGGRDVPKGSNVVPFWVCYDVLVRDYNGLPKKELHRRVWVGFSVLRISHKPCKP